MNEAYTSENLPLLSRDSFGREDRPFVIAIDGPAGSGKSTVSKRVAHQLHLAYLDTGAMYRAAAWWAQHQGIDLNDTEAVAQAVKHMPLDISLDPLDQRFVCDGIDITRAIRASELSKVVSRVATNLKVRELLVHKQREIIEHEHDSSSYSHGRGIVAEGRDITTVVAPDAPVRILLTASEQARLARRALENKGNTDATALAATKDEVLRRDRDDSTVVNFTEAAEGVLTLDTSDLTIDQVVQKVVDIVEDISASSDDQRTAMLRGMLDEYELDDDDRDVLDHADLDRGYYDSLNSPVLAVIGRPNVGKSTLVNRIVGKRVAVVQDRPGVTRDRVRYQAQWIGRTFTLVDTGGWEQGLTGLDQSVAEQSEYAIADSDAVLFVLDATVGITAADEQLVQILRRSGKPVLLAANKVDSQAGEADAAALWNLGLGEPYPVSALHGRGVGDLLDAVMKALPRTSAHARPDHSNQARRIALVGRPNVGKSSLLNKLANEERVVVNEQAGTTRDPVDEVIDIDGTPWVFVDTAGIRRRVHQTRGADYYASLRTQNALEKAELALVILDASQSLTEQDIRVMQQVVDAGRAMVIVCNKWDQVDEERRYELDRELDTDLNQIGWVTRINISAKTGWHINRLTRAMNEALSSWDMRIPTSKLNAFLGQVVSAHPHPVRGGKQPRILFATQAGNRPPRFVLFASGFIDHGYRRFLEHQLRSEFGFEGTPIQISVRVRERRNISNKKPRRSGNKRRK